MRSSRKEETFTTPVEPMQSENDNSDPSEHERMLKKLETECSNWITEAVYFIDLFGDLSSKLAALKTPAELGYFQNLNSRDKININDIDTNRIAFYQLLKGFNEKKSVVDETKMLTKEFLTDFHQNYNRFYFDNFKMLKNEKD